MPTLEQWKEANKRNAPVLGDRLPWARFYQEERMKDLTFREVTKANVSRCFRWHRRGLSDWSVSDWAVAMAGEAGEACNAVKKLRRIEDEIANVIDPDRQLFTRQQATAKIAEELADTFLYIDLLAARLHIDLPAAIVDKFNATSQRYGFPEKL